MLVNNYYSPVTLEEALQYMQSEGNVKALAGGSDLNILLHERSICLDAIVDLSHIEELKKIEFENGILHIGSMCTFTSVAESDLVKEHCPMLALAAASVGSTQVRNIGTVGGNLANAATAADTVPAFMAADAVVVVKSADGERIIPVTDVPTGLNKTCLEKDELIVEFQLKSVGNFFTDFEKIGRRKALAISRINMAMVLDLDGNIIRKASVAFGAVGKTAYRMTELEEYLKEKIMSDELIDGARQITEETVVRVLNGRSTTDYKKKIAAAVVKRALVKAMGGDAE